MLGGGCTEFCVRALLMPTLPPKSTVVLAFVALAYILKGAQEAWEVAHWVRVLTAQAQGLEFKSPAPT